MTETLDFEIVFLSDFWDRPPSAKISVDDQILFQGDVVGDPEQNKHTVRFAIDLECDQQHCLQIDRSGKDDTQCVVADGISKDQILRILQLKIDGIDVQNLVWHRSWFEPQYPEPWASQQQQQGTILESAVPGETWLGHNGIWYFEFRSPFYQFLISQFR